MLKNRGSRPTQPIDYSVQFKLRSLSASGLVLSLVILISPSLIARQNPAPGKYTEVVVSEDGREFSFEMIEIPAGTFQMGSPTDEPGRKEDEGPQHPARLSKFYLGATEVSLDLFMVFYEETMTEKKGQASEAEDAVGVDAVSGPTPVYGDLTLGAEVDHPAIGMSWLNAVTFCKWLSQKTGKNYRLPTEAEWEYACRAGTSNVWGATSDEDQLNEIAWWDENSDGTTHAVATREPNPWGLYDLSGNVREWVHDFYSPGAYAQIASDTPVEDPKGPTTGRVHVARGGDWSSLPEELRCAARAHEVPDWRSLDPQVPKSQWWLPFMDFIGFRVARSAD